MATKACLDKGKIVPKTPGKPEYSEFCKYVNALILLTVSVQYDNFFLKVLYGFLHSESKAHLKSGYVLRADETSHYTAQRVKRALRSFGRRYYMYVPEVLFQGSNSAKC